LSDGFSVEVRAVDTIYNPRPQTQLDSKTNLH
jgi:hypothetical protein